MMKQVFIEYANILTQELIRKIGETSFRSVPVPFTILFTVIKTIDRIK